MPSTTPPVPAGDELSDDADRVIAAADPKPGHATVFLEDGPVLEDPTDG